MFFFLVSQMPPKNHWQWGLPNIISMPVRQPTRRLLKPVTKWLLDSGETVRCWGWHSCPTSSTRARWSWSPAILRLAVRWLLTGFWSFCQNHCWYSMFLPPRADLPCGVSFFYIAFFHQQQRQLCQSGIWKVVMKIRFDIRIFKNLS